MYSEVLYIVKRIIHFYKSHFRLMYHFYYIYVSQISFKVGQMYIYTRQIKFL